MEKGKMKWKKNEPGIDSTKIYIFLNEGIPYEYK